MIAIDDATVLFDKACAGPSFGAQNKARATFNLGKEEEPDSETFHWNPAGSNPARKSWDQQPEASLAW